MSWIYKAKVTQSLIQYRFQLLNALQPGQYEIISTRICRSSPQLLFETQGADTTQPWAERGGGGWGERAGERLLARSATLAARWGSEQRRAVISVLLFRQESLFPEAVAKTRCCTHSGPEGPQLTLMWNHRLSSPSQNQHSHSAAISFSLLCLSVTPAHPCPTAAIASAPTLWELCKPLNLWTTPATHNVHTALQTLLSDLLSDFWQRGKQLC